MGADIKRKLLVLACGAMLLMTPPGLGDGRRLIPGGQAVGVSVATRGVTVVGVASGGEESPARAAGLRAGDVIRAVDGRRIDTALALRQAAEKGRPLRLTVRREGRDLELPLTPVKGKDGSFRLGAWVRDGAAGIGTLTFIDPQTSAFGALGHAITDADTGRAVEIDGGALLSARIQGVRKSQAGSPGELLGALGNERLGTVDKNTPFGVFGEVDEDISGGLYPQGVEILPRGEARQGPATLLATVDGGVREYACEVVSLRDQSRPDTRGLILRVTDEALLSATGGIVQGMSGSPILQDGRLLGAVTHVCLGDPQCGYGVYIDWMLEQADSLGSQDRAA